MTFLAASSHEKTSVASPPRERWICCALTALLWWLAGQQAGLFTLGWIALVPLLWSLHGMDCGARVRFAWATGFCCFALINWWIAPTIARAGSVIGFSLLPSALLGVVAVFLIAVIHGALVAVASLCWQTRGKFSRRFPWIVPIIFAVAWSSLDAVRSLTPLAHSWGALAFTQWRDVALLQAASLVGQHGLTFLCVWFAASVALWMRRGHRILLFAPLLVFSVLHVWGAWRVAKDDAAPQNLRLSVLLVQTSVPSLRKNARGGEYEPFRQAYQLTRDNAQPGRHHLIVWPETTVDLAGSDTAQWDALFRLSRELQTPLLIGARTFDRRSMSYFNDALLFHPNGDLGRSSKARLVPFGERAPFGEQWPFLQRFATSPEVTPAHDNRPLALNMGTEIGSIICFESCFAQPSRALKAQGAQAIFVLTNDEWFRGTEAPWQHAAMAAVRAVENNLAFAQAANGGYSFAVDRHGRFMVKSSFNAAQTLDVELRLE